MELEALVCHWLSLALIITDPLRTFALPKQVYYMPLRAIATEVYRFLVLLF
jgi:hypothetical protein